MFVYFYVQILAKAKLVGDVWGGWRVVPGSFPLKLRLSSATVDNIGATDGAGLPDERHCPEVEDVAVELAAGSALDKKRLCTHILRFLPELGILVSLGVNTGTPSWKP